MAENSRPLNIRLGVKDQEVVSRALRNLGKEGEAALKKLEKASADSSARMKAHRAAAQELNGVFQQMAQRAGPLAPLLSRMGAAGTIAAAGIGALSVGLKASITAAAEAEKMQLRLGAVLRATGGAAGLSKQQLLDYATELQDKLKISDETIVESMSVLATFRNISGDTFKQATELAADMALVFKTDLTAASKQLGLALNDPAAGMTALRRAGVSFTSEQKELIRTLQETGDLAGAQKIILQELVDEIGGSAAAEGRGLAGRTRGLALAWDDMLEAVGNTGPIQSATTAVIGLLEAVTEIAKPESTQQLVAAQEKVVADLQKRLGTDYHFTAGRRRVAEAQEELRLLRQRLAVEELEATAAELKAGRIEKNRIAADKAAQEEDRAEKARKKGAAEAKRAAAEAARTAEREAEQRRDALAQIQENIDALEQETGNLKLNERERAAAVEIQKQEAVARKANIDLTADQIDATRKAALANFDLKESIEGKQKADQDAARAIEDAARKAEDEQKRRAEAAQKIWDNAAENIQDALAGSIRGAFDSNEEGFIKSFFSRMVDLAKDAAAQMAAALIIQPTLGAIGFPGIGGNAPASGGGVSGILGAAGNAASLGNFLRGGSSLFGLGGAQGGVARLLSTGSLSSVGPIAPGFGTAIGAALPVVGAAAAAIGLAKALGLGGKKSVGPNAGGSLDVGPGGFFVGEARADNGGNVAGVQGAIGQAAELLNALTKVPGLGVAGPAGRASFIDTFGAGGITDAAGLVRDVINKGLITGLKESERDILNSASDLGAAIEQVLNAREFPQLIADQLLELTDPKAFRLKQLDAALEVDRQMAQAANDNGETLLNVEKIYAIRRQEIIEQFGEKTVDALADTLAEINAQRLSIQVAEADQAYAEATRAVEAARATLVASYNHEAGALRDTITRFSEFARSIRSFRDSLFTGELSPLSEKAQKQVLEETFFSLANRARLGENIDPEELQHAASQFLESARVNSRSALEYTREVARVYAALEDSSATAQRQAELAQQQLTALDQSVAGMITVNESVISVRDAIDRLAAALLEQKQAASNPGGKNSADAIAELYRNILDRPPDSGGLDYWRTQAAAGQSIADIAANIVRSQEFSVVNPGLTGLYEGVFNRAPDAEGLAYWQGQLDAGASLDSVRENFIRSDEFKSIYGVPAFASGGWADGWSMVGEKGPELVNLRGQVYSNADSRSMLDFSPLAQEIRGLREDQRAQALSMAQLQSRMVKLFDRWEGQGMPPVRVVA